jgi:selenocysteine lyase/cysteine desulfurase
VQYLEELGRMVAPSAVSRRAALVSGTEAIRQYEAQLTSTMLDVLCQAKAKVYGITHKDQICHRTPTLCFNLPGISPAQVTTELANRNIGVRDGHMYSPRLMKRLGLTKESGAVRASLVHYNTVDEVRRFGDAISQLRAS